MGLNKEDIVPSYCGSHTEVSVALARIEERLKSMDNKLDKVVQDTDKKVSFRTFLILLGITSSVLGYLFLNIQNIEAKIDRYKDDLAYIKYEIIQFQKSINSCDFSQYTEEHEHGLQRNKETN